MKFATLDGRAVLIGGSADTATALDIATASDGRFGPDPMDLFAEWADVVDWAATVDPTADGTPISQTALGRPVPAPRQVFAIGLNYRTHAEESGMDIPSVPATFTKFPASLAGPHDDIEIVGNAVDWEVELVAVIGATADRVDRADAWDHIAGLTVGQDISDRKLQFAAGMQFSLGKSRRGYGPMGPWLVTPDEFDDPNDLGLGCRLDGETVQDARTSDLIFSIPDLVAELSSVLPLWPGDVIFTGTPSGVGMARDPRRSLQPGQVLETWVEGIGTMTNRCVGPASDAPAGAAS
ncbi:MAG: fumarylacetoacetate hydrolase family protein [Acidimicrobiales bacterium]